MEKKEFALIRFILFIGIIGAISVICVNSASAELNLRVTGNINNFTSDLRLKTNSNADLGFDSYDMPIRSPPSSYSQFYSSITGYDLAIDSWPSSSRTLELVYNMVPAQTGTLTFSWSSGALGGAYDASLTDYGDDSGYSSQVGGANMESVSTYSKEISGESDIYIKITITPSEAPPGEAPTVGGVPSNITGIVIANKIMNVYIALDEVKTRKINLYNQLERTIETRLSVKGLKDYLIIKNSSFNLGPGERKGIDVRIVAPEKPGIYTGKIIVDGLRRQEILVTLNVNSKELLFDVSVVIPDEFKKMSRGKNLQAQTTLIPMGEEIRLDVTLNYLIKDFEGRTFLTESETMLVEEQKSFIRKFITQNLPVGNYVLGLELEYPNGLATSSSHFEIVEGELPALIDYRFILLILGAGILILIIVILIISRRYKNIKKTRLVKR